MTLALNVTNLKYGKYDMASEKINNNNRLIDRAIQSNRYLRGPSIAIFQIDAPYCCIGLFIKDYMKMRTRLPG